MEKVRFIENKEELQKQLVAYISSFSKVFVLVDSNTEKHCLPLIKPVDFSFSYNVISIPAGEQNKTLSSCEFIWKTLTENNTDRNALLISLGGGMITDIGGFAAATFKRGIPHIHIPTSLLAMVDASVGGKNGVDFHGIKNLIGTIDFNYESWICPAFLHTLPERELKSGFAEIIKHYLIADAKSFQFISDSEFGLGNLTWFDTIQKAVAIKQHFVAKDPYEKNDRKALNFGHTIGHAVESVFLNTNAPLLHGEAVALGMICESYISHKKDLLSAEDLKEISEFIVSNFNLPKLGKSLPILDFVRHDKKNTNTINFALLNGIGNYAINQPVSEDLIVASLNYFNEQNG
ncbi:MAG TPA: 3-dehydroquinate synthase family protein [Chitinophagales bacterium]